MLASLLRYGSGIRNGRGHRIQHIIHTLLTVAQTWAFWNWWDAARLCELRNKSYNSTSRKSLPLDHFLYFNTHSVAIRFGCDSLWTFIHSLSVAIILNMSWKNAQGDNHITCWHFRFTAPLCVYLSRVPRLFFFRAHWFLRVLKGGPEQNVDYSNLLKPDNEFNSLTYPRSLWLKQKKKKHWKQSGSL